MKALSFFLILFAIKISNAKSILNNISTKNDIENNYTKNLNESELLENILKSFSKDDLAKIFPVNYTEAQIKENLLKNLKAKGLELTTQNFDFQNFIIADAFLTTPQLLKKYGYPSEVHTVQTVDGYLLEMHRIPKPGGIPVYLQHGLLDSSAAWVIMGPHSAFGYMLYDLGFDVWMGNVRGNTYSKNHLYLNTKSSKFWDFSFHEIGVYDVPAMMDYITQKTGYKKMHYISHSQGSTIFFVMCHLRPGYCNRVITMNALSPIAFLSNVRSPLIRLLSTFVNSLEFISKIFGVKEILPNNDILKMAGQVICKKEALTQALCSNLLFLIVGYDSEQLNKTMLPAIVGHVPAGASIKQLVHYGQLIRSGKFRMYDYGIIKNWFIYGSLRPPLYDLSKVTAPITIHYSMNDWMAHPVDVHRLEEFLPNIQETRIVPLPKFNHMDFIYAIDVRELLYKSVVENMFEKQKYDQEKLK